MKRVFWIGMIGCLVSCIGVSQEIESKTKTKTMHKVVKTNEQWRAELNEEEYRVLRQCGTELPGSGKYYNFYEDGVYECAACGSELFSSETKYASGSGWPSFTDVLSDTTVMLLEDNSHNMKRIEVKCANCGGHLGHVFPDGPAPTYKRYCINSVSMKFTSQHDRGENK